MQLDNNIQREKRKAREDALRLSSNNSPNLDEMQVFYLDEHKKTALYFTKNTPDNIIKERLAKYFRKDNLNIIENYSPQEKIVEIRQGLQRLYETD